MATFHVPSVGGLGSIPGQRTRSHMLQLRPSKTKIKYFEKIFFTISCIQFAPLPFTVFHNRSTIRMHLLTSVSAERFPYRSMDWESENMGSKLGSTTYMLSHRDGSFKFSELLYL